MTIGERLRLVRNELHVTQQKMADTLHVKRQTIAAYEIGANGMSDRTIAGICDAYGVNEIWLRTGEGEMLANRDRPVVEEISAFLADVIADKPGNVRQRLVYALAKLTDDQWDALDKMLDQMIEDMRKAAPD